MPAAQVRSVTWSASSRAMRCTASNSRNVMTPLNASAQNEYHSAKATASGRKFCAPNGKKAIFRMTQPVASRLAT